MPSFELDSTRSFWEQYMNGQVADIIKYMELFESGSTQSDENVQPLLKEFEEKLDQASSVEGLALSDLIHIAASMHMSQKLRLMQVVDSISPGVATKMISVAESNQDQPASAKFLERNKKFERIRILKEVYHPSRLNALMSLYE